MSQAIVQKLRGLARTLESQFLGKQETIRLMVLSVLAGEHIALIGPPGTAKSALVRNFARMIDSRYFEYLLTRFSEPNELFGPVDIPAFRQGTYRRRTEGMLPDAEIVFLDEIFKSNSAILNTLLTIVNERKYYQDGEPTPVALRMLFAATNEIPAQTELDALADRFILKIETHPVKDTHFTELIDAGVINDVYKATAQRPWVRGTVTYADYLKFKHFMDLSMGEAGSGAADRARWFPPAVFAEFRRIVRALETEDRVMVSDRKLVKLYRLLRTRAFLLRAGAVTHDDLVLLCYVGNRRHELPAVQEKVRRLLGMDA